MKGSTVALIAAGAVLLLAASASARAYQTANNAAPSPPPSPGGLQPTGYSPAFSPNGGASVLPAGYTYASSPWASVAAPTPLQTMQSSSPWGGVFAAIAGAAAPGGAAAGAAQPSGAPALLPASYNTPLTPLQTMQSSTPYGGALTPVSVTPQVWNGNTLAPVAVTPLQTNLAIPANYNAASPWAAPVAAPTPLQNMQASNSPWGGASLFA